MFIFSPTKGGYRGDVVNSGFRQGRQDAYRDYVDNFNFATKADAANNAENQLEVQRIANNYGLQNKMRQNARDEAFNFVTDASKLDNAVVANNINFAKNNDLWAKAQDIGRSQAGEAIATQAGNENKAINANTKERYLTENPYLIQGDTQATYQQKAFKNQAIQADIANTQANAKGKELSNTAFQFNVDDMDSARADRDRWSNMSDDDVGKSMAIDYVKQLQANGDTRSVDEIISELKANPNYSVMLDDYRQSAIDRANSQFNQAAANLSTRSSRRIGNPSSTTQEQSVSFKANKQGDGFDPVQYLNSLDGTPILNDDGNPVAKVTGNIVHTPSGSYNFKHKPTEEEIRDVLGLAPKGHNGSQGSIPNANAGI